LHEFLAEPEHPRFREAGNRAQQLRAEHQRRVTQVAEKTVEMRRVWNQPLSRRAPLVFALIGLSVFATLTTEFAQNSRNPFLNILMFCDLRSFEATSDGLLQLKQGQVWRLVTPIFLHGGWLHLFFNMSWLYTLGAQIETRRGTPFLGLLVLIVAVISNGAQYVLGHSPLFLGMSGVAYGLFGYVWARQKLEPRSGYLLGESTVFLMLFVLVLGFAGSLDGMVGRGGVANWCHAGGLVAGILVAWLVKPKFG